MEPFGMLITVPLTLHPDLLEGHNFASRPVSSFVCKLKGSLVSVLFHGQPL